MENSINENNSRNQKELVNLWTEMGASTGSMIGRLIGVGAVLGLETINAINKPLSQGLEEMRKNIKYPKK